MDIFRNPHTTNNNSESEDAEGSGNKDLDPSLSIGTPIHIRRRVGYEIERRLVKAVQARTLKRKTKKKGHYHYYPFYDDNNKSSCFARLFRRILTPHEPDDYIRRKRRRRRRRRHHRFCVKCVTSSFRSLFRVITFRPPYDDLENNREVDEDDEFVLADNAESGFIPKRGIVRFRTVTREGAAATSGPEVPEVVDEDKMAAISDKLQQHQRPYSRSINNESRTPTPKMLLDLKSGALQWPVYQFGGQSGSGLVVNTEALKKKRVSSKSKNNPAEDEIGRENFSLGGKPIEVPLQFYPNKKSAPMADERKLIGWLQVRDPKNHRKSFLQVVNPAPEGPFRKAPWHGNVHVLKF